jgi:cytidyltransferase-like protein
MKIVLCTGGYDPVHSGHLAYFKSARALGDRLIVGLNSDAWLTRKKGRPFMPLHERLALVGNLNMVDEVVVYNDDDDSSSDAIRVVRARHPDADIVFANGGDRTAVNIPEMDIVDNNLEFAFGVGGEDKQNSSSWILQEWKAPKTPRQWGYYRVLHEVAGMKVKELTVNPGCSLSMQRHQHRAEYWIVSEGQCVVNSIMPTGYALPPAHLVPHQEFRIPKTEWHQLTNPFDAPCKIVEIQYGEQCEEEDIERQ